MRVHAKRVSRTSSNSREQVYLLKDQKDRGQRTRRQLKEAPLAIFERRDISPVQLCLGCLRN